MRNDSEFLMRMGIAPCLLDDPFPKRPSPHKPEGLEIPLRTEHDDRWLSSCGAAWEPEPEETAKRLLVELPEGHTFDDFLQEVIAEFIQGSKQGDDLARMCANSRPPEPGTCKSAHFHALVKHFVEGIAMTLYPPAIPGMDSACDKEE